MRCYVATLLFLALTVESAVVIPKSQTSHSSAADVTNPCVPGSKMFAYTGTIESFTAPRGCVVVMALWGAGGSNSPQAPGGGGGGYIRGAIEGYGQTIYVLVGQGAIGEVPNDGAWPGQGPFFGGGGHQGNYCGHAGGGGGRSQVSLAPNDVDVDSVLLVAGGGGGGGTCRTAQGGSGGGRDDAWEPHMNGGTCGEGGYNYGKGGYGGRPHNEFFRGHSGGDNGGGGGGGYYGGGAGEGHCQYGSAGGGGSSYWNKDYITSVELISAKGPVTGYSLLEFGLSVGMGGTGHNGAGGNGLVMVTWYPNPDYVKKQTGAKK